MVKQMLKVGAVSVLVAVIGVAAAMSAEKDPLVARVPPDQIAAAKGTPNPFKGNPAMLAEGKMIFEGKGTCFTCHGMEGKGDGPAATGLDPSPRNFTNSAFEKAKTPGEMMWILKNGSAGTAMIPVVGAVITEEEGWKAILYERSLGGEKP